MPMPGERGTEGRQMTLREVIEELSEMDEDVMDQPVTIEDQYGNCAYVTDVVDANGPFLWPSKDFEESS